ncbi:MAG: hypothetical protein ACYDHY_09515 [Acidiferrobacterales bacterium]
MKTKRSSPSRSSHGPRTVSDPPAILEAYCKDIDRWPQGWAGFPELDVPVGQRIVEEFKPFLLALIDQGRAQKTVKKYADYLWALGGELIRHVNEIEADRKLPTRKLILNHIDETGGPYWRHAHNARDREAYDSVCRRLYHFMTGARG